MIHTFIIAPDSFKESMTAKQAGKAIARGFKTIYGDAINTVTIPMADGGEGTMQSLADALHGKVYKQIITGPLGEKVEAAYAISTDRSTAIIEMAEASGLALIPPSKRNPLITTTYGTGELIKAALEQGVSKIILGIGGSATNDGGAGMIAALGGRFHTSTGEIIPQGGATLADVVSLDLMNVDPRLKETEMFVACDVTNPLLGPNGASAVYGPQKGATAEMVKELDQALENFHNVLLKETGKNVKDIPGAGAAGGLGAGLLACCDATLQKGIDIVLKETEFERKLKSASLVITGEGKLDDQTIYGKTPIGVAKAAKEKNVPVIALCGTLGNGYEAVYDHGIDAVFSIARGPGTLDEALQTGEENLQELARNVASMLRIGNKL